MKAIYNNWVIHVDITNACPNRCPNCTRYVGHHQKPYFMNLKMIEKCIDSLEMNSPDGFKGHLGIMGGEPTTHPEFRKICKLIQKKGLAEKTMLFTAGYKWSEYKKIIKETFKYRIFYNDHADKTQTHQPLMVAIDEVMDDKKKMWQLIDKCWVQEKWSATMNSKGAFFCEVAASQDLLFGGPGGYKIEKGWWRKDPKQFQDQVRRYCKNCSGALPMEKHYLHQDYDLVSPNIYKKLKKVKSPKLLGGKVKVFDKKITNKDIQNIQNKWTPWEYLGITQIRKMNIRFDELYLVPKINLIIRKVKELLK